LKQKPFVPETVSSYKEIILRTSKKASQTEFFSNLLNGSPEENFDYLWNVLYKDIKHFGRFSTWNFAQMLKSVAGLNIEPNDLFLGQSNSKSRTHGLCFAFGKDEWTKDRKKVFSKEEIEELNQKTENLYQKIKEIDEDADLFKVETVACAFKKIFRENDSRYVGYYLDRQAEDIKKMESKGVWEGIDWRIFWEGRKEMLNPKALNDDRGVRKSRFKESPEQKCFLVVDNLKEVL
jgi:hypothetical protein